ncbi:PTS lactose/cellobiose transporter subunit IIA [Anaerorhabdus sp.]|jgi:cellobiose PTS system EIIA component|uniref:Lichenan-specific phosphotransferase enzyme IIA component n=1 Tax=bioreactor metagenome TaxID=1076179 RepID=A0A645JEZ8_9ZZZZ|nr:PTS lactose/cellobiose transporter subunit IIA [Anaerorhabdus sp.]MEA4874838.1 PTS lactose/cellobiose transporter subunit IIA [Anaerorhabdus sp.]
MANITNEELNNAAMQIILHAGNCRNLLNEALLLLEDEENNELVDSKMKEAKKEITEAHKVQTNMIQATIEDDQLNSTLLFSHAQDTLMTIYSELNIAGHIIRLFKKMNERK